MALTLEEAAKYSNDILQAGVIEKLIYQDPILEKLQWKDIKGNGLRYTIEKTMSDAKFYGVNETWVQGESEVDSETALTTILGGDADVDNFLQATRSDVNDLMGEQITAKIKAIKKAFMEMFYYGYSTVDTKGFTGLHGLIKSVTPPYANVVAIGGNDDATALAMGYIEEAVDLVKNGKPSLIIMSKLMRRAINTKLMSVGGLTYADAAQRRVQTLYEIPVAVSDYISNTEDCSKLYTGSVYGHDYTQGVNYTASTTTARATTIFILQFAPEAVCGLQSLPLTVEKLGHLETKDAERVRIKWYPGLMLQNIVSVAKVTGIDPWAAVSGF